MLPLDATRTEEAGETRYLGLFDGLNKSVTATIKRKGLALEAMPLIHDSLFAPLNCHTHSYRTDNEKNSFVVGRFIKFHQAGEVEDLYTKATLFKAQDGQAAIANRREFIYIFNPKTHWLAIEEQNGRLPNAGVVERALVKFLRPIAEEMFPDYTLQVNLISRKDELLSVLERATGFTKIEVDITFKNGPTQDQVLQDMAANSLHRLKLSATSERGAHMPRVPETIEGIVKNAAEFGTASITYLETNDKGQTTTARYESECNPETISMRARGDEDPMNFYARISGKIKQLAEKITKLQA